LEQVATVTTGPAPGQVNLRLGEEYLPLDLKVWVLLFLLGRQEAVRHGIAA
jgi:hypothetical protein